MALTEETVVTITVLGREGMNGTIEVEKASIFKESSVEKGRSKPWRRVVNPGDDVSGEDARVQAVANAVWTPKVVSDFQAAQAAREADLE